MLCPEQDITGRLLAQQKSTAELEQHIGACEEKRQALKATLKDLELKQAELKFRQPPSAIRCCWPWAAESLLGAQIWVQPIPGEQGHILLLLGHRDTCVPTGHPASVPLSCPPLLYQGLCSAGCSPLWSRQSTQSPPWDSRDMGRGGMCEVLLSSTMVMAGPEAVQWRCLSDPACPSRACGGHVFPARPELQCRQRPLHSVGPPGQLLQHFWGLSAWEHPYRHVWVWSAVGGWRQS